MIHETDRRDLGWRVPEMACRPGRPDLYRKDGLHMTDRGAEVLGAGLARAMGSGGAPFLN